MALSNQSYRSFYYNTDRFIWFEIVIREIAFALSSNVWRTRQKCDERRHILCVDVCQDVPIHHSHYSSISHSVVDDVFTCNAVFVALIVLALRFGKNTKVVRYGNVVWTAWSVSRFEFYVVFSMSRSNGSLLTLSATRFVFEPISRDSDLWPFVIRENGERIIYA